ncbi:phage/plasmid primase, P4 family [Alkalihalobacillus oceani]|uniref:phage/plasmid primase, P4 family n=1 Tax=Halalkalibacter oceani TaxID=1653776 RepID=UPI00203BCC98|nr:phage/plasmid primase, P4 family [Halalkalibacter oceani]MCM3761054.1 phage/plasmid primase, P4 family [Halalkalibacter oceani]
MMKFTLYTADYKGNLSNCLYPKKAVIKDKSSFIEAIKFDHVSAKYKDNYRSNANFIKADNIVLDCDNDHSDDPGDWVSSLDVAMAFPRVAYAISYSRNHMKQKGSKSPRPRFHVYFMIPETSSRDEYTKLKQEIASNFPFFDTNALDSARFIFGTDNEEVEFFEGSVSIKELLEDTRFADWDKALEEIPEGKRNSTMSHYAGRIIKRFGNTAEAYSQFLKQAEKCSPPLDESELKLIWNSAVSFGKKVAKQTGYIPPEVYNSNSPLKPADFSDVGQAVVLAREYEKKLRYSPATDFIVYNGSFWEESKPKAQAIAQELTTRQLEEAEAEMKKAMAEMVKNGATELLATMGAKKAASAFNKQQSLAFNMFEAANTYRNYAIKRRDSKYIASSLREAQPMLEIKQTDLDTDEFLLNTPKATYDLRLGTKVEHDSSHFITKETAVEPSDGGLDKWGDALDTFFLKDKDLIDYVQKIVGLAAIGKVYVEALIIAYGEGRNGKSTFWNAISRVLGTYSGNISADMLTVGCRRNVKPELAEAKGKRLLIAAEMEEGMRLNTSNIKQLCSTDEIYAEKKYKDPFSYIPSHTLVLYTNHLPKVGAIDKGTWRRLIVIPFAAKIEGKQDIKNYGDYLFEKAGGAILAWIIEGAKRVIEDEYQIDPPQKVKDAIAAYKENNDWLAHFLNECCELGEEFTAKSGEVYEEYRAFCIRTGEYTRSTADFYTALELAEFTRQKTRKGVIIKGLRLKSEFLE